jgi:NTP pyrophosphatase (non-canonical NTP hydrolase)
MDIKRPEINLQHLSHEYGEILRTMDIRLQEKGRGIYVSNHEALGIITEEYYELIEAVKSNEDINVRQELIDIAVACIIALGSKYIGMK